MCKHVGACASLGKIPCILECIPTCITAMQPIAGDPFPSDTSAGASRYVELLSRAFDISDARQDMMAVSRREAVAALAHEKPGELLDQVFAAFQDYKTKYKHDMVLIGGTHEGALLALAQS